MIVSRLRNNREWLYTVLLPQFLFIYSIFIDNINGYFQYYMGFNSGIGVLFRGGVIMLLFPVVLRISRNWLANNMYMLLLVYLFCIAIWSMFNVGFSFAIELDRLFKIIYFFAVVLFFLYFRECFDREKLLMLAINAGLIIAIINTVCFLGGVGIKSYGDDFGFGVKAFYMDGNSLGLYMVMLLGIGIWYLFYRPSIFILVKILVITFGTLIIGSRVAILGTCLLWCLLCSYYCLRHDNLIRINLHIKRMLFCGILVLMFYALHFVFNFIVNVDGFSKERFSIEGVLSTREFLIDSGKRVLNSYAGVDLIIGKGYSGGMFELAKYFSDNAVKYKGVENDFYSLLVSYGYILGGYLILFFMVFYKKYFANNFFHFRDSLSFTFFAIGTLWIGASVIAGHGIFNVMLAPLFGLASVVSYDKKRIVR